jgi:hypothetical protein
MRTIKQIIGDLGGMRTVARALGHSNHTTVQGWMERDSVPVQHWSALVQLAQEQGKELTLRELMPAELRDAAA